MTGDASDADARVRRLLMFAGACTTAGSVVFWAWVRHGARACIVLTAAAVVVPALAVASRRGRYRRAAEALLLAAAVTAIGSFYVSLRQESSWTARPGLGVGAQILLGVTVFAVLFQYCLLAVSFLTRPRWGWRVFAVAVAASAIVAADLYFMPTWDPENRFERGRYHPFLTYDDQGTYAYAHAQERWVRDLRGVRFSQRKPVGVVRIVLAGASTMWGVMQPDDQGPAVRLLRHLRAAEPDRVFEVLTIAQCGKYQLNELIDATVTLPHWEPDLVVSWNGFNEIWYGEGDGRYEGQPYVAVELEASVEASDLQAWFFRHTFFGAWVWQRWRHTFEKRHGLHERDAYEPPRYFAYLRRTACILASEGIRYAHSFCPNLAEKEPRSADEQRVELPVARAAIAERRRRSAEILREEGQHSYNAMEALTGTADTFFVDPCHLTDDGLERAMQDLARRALEWLRQPEPGSSHDS